MSKDKKSGKTVWTNHYLCVCGEHWEDRHDCCCNDRCPRCNTEIEPYISDDGSVSEELIAAALEETLVKLGLCRCEDCDGFFRESDLEEISNFKQRVSPGEEAPAGQCPDCGSLAHRVKKPESLWVVVHTHEYGTTVYLVKTAREPTKGQVIKRFKIDFEPDKGEGLEIIGPETPQQL